MGLHSPLKWILLSFKCNENYGNLADQKENLTLLINDIDKVHFSFFIGSRANPMFIIKLMGKSVRVIKQWPLEKLLLEVETELKAVIYPCIPFSFS